MISPKTSPANPPAPSLLRERELVPECRGDEGDVPRAAGEARMRRENSVSYIDMTRIERESRVVELQRMEGGWVGL